MVCAAWSQAAASQPKVGLLGNLLVESTTLTTTTTLTSTMTPYCYASESPTRKEGGNTIAYTYALMHT